MRKDNLLFINGKDAWLTWNVLLIENSYENLLTPSPMKKYTENKSRSQPGKQVFIVNPMPDERTVILIFDMECKSRSEFLQKYESFLHELRSGYLEFKVNLIDKTFYFYWEDSQSLNFDTGFRSGKFSIRLNEPLSVPVVFDALSTEGTDLILTEDGKTIII